MAADPDASHCDDGWTMFELFSVIEKESGFIIWRGNSKQAAVLIITPKF